MQNNANEADLESAAGLEVPPAGQSATAKPSRRLLIWGSLWLLFAAVGAGGGYWAASVGWSWSQQETAAAGAVFATIATVDEAAAGIGDEKEKLPTGDDDPQLRDDATEDTEDQLSGAEAVEDSGGGNAEDADGEPAVAGQPISVTGYDEETGEEIVSILGAMSDEQIIELNKFFSTFSALSFPSYGNDPYADSWAMIDFAVRHAVRNGAAATDANTGAKLIAGDYVRDTQMKYFGYATNMLSTSESVYADAQDHYSYVDASDADTRGLFAQVVNMSDNGDGTFKVWLKLYESGESHRNQEYVYAARGNVWAENGFAPEEKHRAIAIVQRTDGDNAGTNYYLKVFTR